MVTIMARLVASFRAFTTEVAMLMPARPTPTSFASVVPWLKLARYTSPAFRVLLPVMVASFTARLRAMEVFTPISMAPMPVAIE